MMYLDCYSVVSEGLVVVFEWAVVLSVFILMFVFVLVVDICLLGEGAVKFSSESSYLEFIWTLLPLMVLLFMGYPSMLMLFMNSPEVSSGNSAGVVGYQWYWSYYTPTGTLTSYPEGGFRLLDVDSRLVLSSGVWSKVYISSGDVIHSWALPSMGIKMDAVPGRVNMVDLFCSLPGVYYGQCSELCGVGHSFMPVCLEVV
uniref:Cytochrome c oxidase subunit 2 n=1 Tax=Hebesoma violentum TaxID=1410563 RepID=A0A0C4JX69_9BILA|nr:cytochrome c oxidase subunit II [Hebesoma violentum]